MRYQTKVLVFLFSLFSMLGCTEHDVVYTTFTGELVYTYLQKDTTYSEFLKIIDKSGLKGMLSARGDYTCLAPTNNAFRLLYDSLGTHFTVDSLRVGQIDTIAKTHIISGRFHTYDLQNGIISHTNMNHDYIGVEFDSLTGVIRLSGYAQILSKDNDVYNGVVHGIDKVIRMPGIQLPYMMRKNKDISIFTDALFLTGLSDSLTLIADIAENTPKAFVLMDGNKSVVYSPVRKYGYTVFVEDNELLRKNGINSLNELIQRCKQWYPCNSTYDSDYKNRNNSLNRYIAYHLIKKAIYRNKFFFTNNAIQNYTPDEFLETMLPNRIIRVANINAQITLNPGSVSVAHVEEENNMAKNGVYYRIDRLLLYNDGVENMLRSIRIRFDASSLCPELTNNNMRGIEGGPINSLYDYYAFIFEPGYLKNIQCNKNASLFYSAPQKRGSTPLFQGDAINLRGQYDISFRLLPVPPGTYELRFGAGVFSGVSITQIYVDGIPQGIPLYMDNQTLKTIGFIPDNETDDDGVKNDQILRYKGWMKAPNTIRGQSDVAKSARDEFYVVRKIVGKFTSTNYQPHIIRFRSTLNYESFWSVDYFELVPKVVFDPPGGEYESRD